jgi:hypothetical protein
LIEKRYSEKEEAFWRKMILPEEDRAFEWRGGYRWFRSANVVPIELWRRVEMEEPEAVCSAG